MPTYIGTSANDTITGSSGNDIIVGKTGNDHLNGGAGDDIFQVSSFEGFDDVQGGSGYDKIVAMNRGMYIGLSIFQGSSTTEEISANGFSGVYIKGISRGAWLDFSGTTLTGISRIEGDIGNDIITGSQASDNITTLDGDDFIDESGGLDQINGGAGNDAYIFGNNTNGRYTVQQDPTDPTIWTLTNTGTTGSDGYIITANADGTRSVVGTNGSFASLSNVEHLAFDGGVFGSNGNDSLGGGSDSDCLVGFSGDDILDGAKGADSLLGGTGNDTYHVDNAGDTVIEAAGEGSDTVLATLGSTPSPATWKLSNSSELAASLERATT